MVQEIAHSVTACRRVVQIVESSNAGVGRHVLDLLQGLPCFGWEGVLVYCPLRADEKFRRRIQDLPPEHVIPLPMRRLPGPNDLRTIRKLRGLLRELGPFDLVHGHSSKGGLLARLVAKSLGWPSVYTPHAFITLDPTMPAWKRRVYGRAERGLARFCQAVIAVSTDEAEHAVQSLKIPAEKVHVVYNGIGKIPGDQRDSLRKQLNIHQDALVVGWIGRLAPQKDPLMMVRAFAQTEPAQQHAVLVMVGTGDMLWEIQQLARSLGVLEHCRFPGELDGETAMSAFDVFALSSRYEGMPYVIIEAVAAGLPIVATHVGGVANAVMPEVNGFLVPSMRADELGAALRRLIEDVSLRQKFSAASGQMSEKFSLETMLRQTVEVYEQALSR